MAKKLIRLTEGDLHRIIKESVNKVLKEDYFNDGYDEFEKQHRDYLRRNPDAALEDYEDERKYKREREINDMWRQHELENGKGLWGTDKYGNTLDMTKAFDGYLNNVRVGGIKRNKSNSVNMAMQRAIHNGRNPYTQKLHTRGSANRDLLAMDKQKKQE